MKPVLVNNSKIPVFLSFFSPITIWAITIWPFIFCRGVMDEGDVNHESIHIEQYNDLYVIGFLILYGWDWLHGVFKYWNDYDGFKSRYEKAYYRTRAEQEAYKYDNDLEYLDKREMYKWLTEFKV